MRHIAFALLAIELLHFVQPSSTILVYPKFQSRRRREIDSTHVTETLHLGQISFELVQNDDFVLGNNYEVFSDERKLPANEILSNCRFLKGFSESSNHLSAVSVCHDNLITGLLVRNESYYEIQPNGRDDLSHNLEILDMPDFVEKRKKRDVGVVCGTTGFDKIKENDLSQEDTEEVIQKFSEFDRVLPEGDEDIMGYFYDSAWEARKIKRKKVSKFSTQKRWLEIALGVDYSVINFHGIDKVQHYILTLMNIVSAVYQDPSLESNLQLVIARLMLYPEKKHSQVVIGNATRSLENVNAWNRRLHGSLMAGENRHDLAVWLTRLDIGGPSGYAPVAGACNPIRSCTLNRDEGLTCAFIIAHEMAHILGLTHDGDRKSGNTCTQEAQEGSVMAPVVAATFNRFTWSSCSKREFHKKISSWPCLMNSPKGQGYHYLQATLKTSFSMDEQCRIEFGDGYEHCTSFDVSDPCGHLWCGHVNASHFCKTKKGPPLEGTQCGTNKWCFNGYCRDASVDDPTDDPVVHNPRDGGWSEWTEWQSCSRTCGIGVQFRSRNCNNPRPAYGGSNCGGKDEEFHTCGFTQCPEPLTDFRAEQCRRLNQIVDFQGTPKQNMSWLPYEPEQESLKCQLICQSRQTYELFFTIENYLDGTRCSYDSNEGICIQGQCHPISCNGTLTTEDPKEDWCGLCGGDNSFCRNITVEHQRYIRKEESRVLVIPRLARNVVITSNISTILDRLDESVTLFIKDRRKFRYDFVISGKNHQSIVVKGAKFNFRKNGKVMKLWARGPTLAETIVFLQAPSFTVNSGLSITLNASYTVPGSNDTLRYAWEVGGWGSCSVSCGGGRRQKTIACRDLISGYIVPRRKCPLIDKPVPINEDCNTFGCRFRWQPGDWEFCTNTCGSDGIQNRELYCVPQMANNSRPWVHMVKPDRCKGPQPVQSRICNRVPCPGFWHRDGWSECTASCRKGHRSLKYSCLSLGNSTDVLEENHCSTLKPLKERRSCRRRGQCKVQKRRKCRGDRSQYCGLTDLFSKYCTFPPFRRVCCQTCTNMTTFSG